MRSRQAFFALLSLGFAIGMPHLAHASIPYWGPIIPGDVTTANGNFQTCAIGWAGVIIVANNIISFLLTVTIAFVAPLMFAYAGFLYVVSPTNPGGRSQANSMMLNIVVGIVLALASWLIVDTLLSVFYNGAAGGPWYSLITSGGQDPCIKLTGNLSQSPGATDVSGAGTTQNPGAVGAGLNPSPSAIGNCTPSALQTAGLSSNLASTMSCITKSEDGSCNVGAPSGTDIGADGRVVSWGIFQINISAGPTGDLNYPACEALNGGQPLNCSKAFVGGAYTSKNHNTQVAVGQEALYDKCVAAASNPQCNIQAGESIYQKQGIGAWGTTAQRNCSTGG